jgi:hypothetical protein
VKAASKATADSPIARRRWQGEIEGRVADHRIRPVDQRQALTPLTLHA